MSKQNNPITFPDYDNSILSVAASIARYYGIKVSYQTNPLLDTALNKQYKNVVFMMMDGLGTDMLFRHLPASSFLRSGYKATISSVFPPTTTAATTTVQSLLPPISHGWLGWSGYFKERNQVIELFNAKDYYTGEKIQAPDQLMQSLVYNPFWLKPKLERNTTAHYLLPDKINQSGLTSLHKMMKQIQSITESDGSHFIYAYWTNPDHIAHTYGPNSEEVRLSIGIINRRLKRLHTSLKDTLLIVISDHGQTEINKTILINHCGQMADCLSVPLSLEGRCASVFIKPEKKELFEHEFTQYLSSDFLLIPRAEALSAHLFGIGEMHPQADEFIGDYLIVGITDKILGQEIPNGLPVLQLKGAHGGLTQQEMHVPLIIIPSSDIL